MYIIDYHWTKNPKTLTIVLCSEDNPEYLKYFYLDFTEEEINIYLSSRKFGL